MYGIDKINLKMRFSPNEKAVASQAAIRRLETYVYVQKRIKSDLDYMTTFEFEEHSLGLRSGALVIS